MVTFAGNKHAPDRKAQVQRPAAGHRMPQSQRPNYHRNPLEATMCSQALTFANTRLTFTAMKKQLFLDILTLQTERQQNSTVQSLSLNLIPSLTPDVSTESPPHWQGTNEQTPERESG